MKRVISCLLAAILAFAPCLQANALGMDAQISADVLSVDKAEAADADDATEYAKDTGQENSAVADGLAEEITQEAQVPSEDEDDGIVEENPEPEEGRAGNETLTVQTGLSQLDVTIISALVLGEPVNFEVSIIDEGGHVDKEVSTLAKSSVESEDPVTDKATQPTQTTADFEKLSAQTYVLTVKAEGFATYTQEIVIEKSRLYRVTLMTGDCDLEGTSESVHGHPGVLRIGDVDGSGFIDAADKDRIVAAVDEEMSNVPETPETPETDEGSGTPEASEKATKDVRASGLEDLNRDGKTDLVDLEYFAKGYEGYKRDKNNPNESSIETFILPNAVNTTADKGTKVEGGDLSKLLSGEGGGVKLSPKNGQEITEDNPLQVDFALKEGHEEGTEISGFVFADNKENPTIAEADIEITYKGENGQDKTVKGHVNTEGVQYLLTGESVDVAWDESTGTFSVDLGSQVAVKKVTIKISKTKKNNKLAEIAKVEFIGDMASRIPEPQMDIPKELNVTNGSESFTVSWRPCTNVTGYEVRIAKLSEDEKSEVKTCVKQVTGTTLGVLSLGDKKSDEVENGAIYTVQVQAVNGTWRSGYCEAVTAEPDATKVPDPPDNLTLKGQYTSIAASWKKMKSTKSYNLYYKKVEGETGYTKIEGLETTSYNITGLEDKTYYEVYVTGKNDIGESGHSLHRQAQTADMSPAQMPKYKRINDGEDGVISHIENTAGYGGGEMIESPQDVTSGTRWGTVDNDYMSYYRVKSWDLGGYNNNNNGLVYEFDQPYKLQNIALQAAAAEDVGFNYANVRYWNESNQQFTYTWNKLSFTRKQDAHGRNYYWIRLPESITAKRIKIGLGRWPGSNLITVSEVYFYHYDSLEDDILGLYEDDLHTVLWQDVTQTTLDELSTRLNTPDPVSGEYHPDKKTLELELATAQAILNAKELNSPAIIHRGITTAEPGRGFSGLNAWQPLGITAAAGEKLIVFVGHKTMKTGENTNLRLVATQYHSEYNGVAPYTSDVLKIGRNEITIPSRDGGVTGCETGGAVYVQYSGSAANDDYSVRVQGGTAVPILDLYKVTDENEKLEKAKAYAEELTAYVNKMQENHEKLHKGSGNRAVDMDYNQSNCILGASDIQLDNMMLSLPARELSAGAGNGDAAARAQRIVASMDAMEEMMHLFYQHKGLNNSAKDQKDRLPYGHQNIRYQRMFAGAFMYAAGNHIGIEYGSASGLMGGSPIKLDEKGKYESGSYFGWGIAHEVGHCIDQNQYEDVEITNNYFALLAGMKNNQEKVSRFSYDSVYKKVTSNTIGKSSSKSTQLALYWQLRQAYDDGNNYKTYDKYEDQLANLFFARMDTYARTPSKAPNKGVALQLGGGADQCLMRLSCAAAEKNILEFFERWGKIPDATTRAYAEQFEKETRAIYYVNDDARVYRNESGRTSVLGTDGEKEAVGDDTTAVINGTNKNQVDFILKSKDIPNDDILGYEIVRSTTSNGDKTEIPVGFVSVNNPEEECRFTDTVTTMNNRVVTYKVTVIDKFLNRSAVKELPPLKIEHDGEIDKTNWTVISSNIAAVVAPTVSDPNAESYIPCDSETTDSIVNIKDNDTTTTYVGRVTKSNAEVTLEFNQPQTIVAFKYTVTDGNPISAYSFCIKESNGTWTEAASGEFNKDVLSPKGSQTVYLNNANGVSLNIGAYETSAVKLVIKDPVGTKIAISELDVLGITGDNVDFVEYYEKQPAIGILGNEYQYGEKEDEVIPKGSLVFTGLYKGNPAYNVVILYDQDGNLVGYDPAGNPTDEEEELYQVVFANVPPDGEIQDVHEGTWIYWIEPIDEEGTLPGYVEKLTQVRAELYRVDNALTLEGQRLVSDSPFVDMPMPKGEFATITLKSNSSSQ